MSVIFKRAILFLCAIVTVLPQAQVGAVTASTIPQSVFEEYAQNNILFYDPYECNDGSSTTFCIIPSGKDITWIGDSYSVESLEQIKTTFPGVDLGAEDSGNSYSPYYNIQYSKHLDWISSSNTHDAAGGPSGVTILKEIVDSNTLRPYLVLALGTNDTMSESDTTSTLEEIANLVGQNTKVILTTAYTTDDSDYSGGNNAKKNFASSHDNFYVADWAAVAKPDYYVEDSTHPMSNGGYEAWVNTIKEALPQDCTAGLLPGNNVAEKVWNYFVQADIDGISNNAAAIAGIMGNLYTESGLNPFMNGSTGNYYRGLYMLNSDNGGELWNAITSSVGADYWSFYGWWCDVNDYPDGSSCADNVLLNNNVPQDAIDTAIKMELDFLVLGEINGEKASDQAFHTEFMDFIDHFDVITNKNSARSYAELFLITVEIAYETSATPGEAPQDPGVRSFGISRGHERWQGAESRGNYAEKFYDRYSSMTVPTTTTSSSTTTSNSNITAASSGGYNKYDDLTDAELWDLAEVAMHENSANITAFKNELSIMANLFEYNSNDPISGHNLWNYIGTGGWFATSNYINGSHDDNISSTYLDATRDVLMKGNRTLPTQILEHDCVGDLEWVEVNGEKHNASNPGNCAGQGLNDNSYYVAGQTKIHNAYGSTYIFYGWMGGEAGVGDPMGYFEDNPPTDTVASNSQNNGNCPDDSKGSGLGGEQIAQAAVKMAWPVQAGQGDDSHVGECEESSGNWITFTTAERPCKTNARAFYREQLIEQGRRQDGMDCGVYVGTVLQYVGAIDNITSTYDMEGDYFEPSDEWEQIENNGVESMKPGDVLLANGAALGHSTGHILFYIGDYGGSYGNIADASLDERVAQVGNIYNDTVWHIWRYKGGIGDGLTPKQAEKLASNYNNNVGNWDGTVAAEPNYCQGSDCASRYSNCTLFSAFFAEMFAGVSQRGWPAGINVVDTLKELGFETGTEPKPFAVFSTNTYHTPSGNHTGVVVGVQGSSIATIEAGYPSLNATYFDYTDVSGENIWYAYLDSELDYTKLMNYINQ